MNSGTYGSFWLCCYFASRVLSLFSIYRTVVLAKKSSKGILDSIVQTLDAPAVRNIKSFTDGFKESVPRLLRMYLPDLSTIPMFLGITWEPTWSSLPTLRTLRSRYRKKPWGKGLERRLRSSFLCLAQEIKSFRAQECIEFGSRFLDVPSLTSFLLFPSWVLYPWDSRNDFHASQFGYMGIGASFLLSWWQKPTGGLAQGFLMFVESLCYISIFLVRIQFVSDVPLYGNDL